MKTPLPSLMGLDTVSLHTIEITHDLGGAMETANGGTFSSPVIRLVTPDSIIVNAEDCQSYSWIQQGSLSHQKRALGQGA